MRGTPIRRSLQRPPTIMGVSPQLMAINFTLSSILVGVLKMWPFLFISVLLHVVFVILTKRDPYTVTILERYQRQGNVYEPFPLPHQNKKTQRPNGWGRDEVI